MEREIDERKFKELILYVADKCSDDPDFGAVKLNKILFYSDFYSDYFPDYYSDYYSDFYSLIVVYSENSYFVIPATLYQN